MDHIQILFKEYDTLRSEAVNRLNHGYQLIGIAAAVLTWLVSRPLDRGFVVTLSVFAVTFFFLGLEMRRDMSVLSARLREIEKQINELAGAELLAWESKYASRATGWLRRKHST